MADRVLITVPYNWESGSCRDHVHDPVDLEKMRDWTGREPNYYVVITEPLTTWPSGQRLICYYHPENEKLNLRKTRKLIQVQTSIDKLTLQIVRQKVESTLELELERKLETVYSERDIERKRNKKLIAKLHKQEIELQKRKAECKAAVQARHLIERRYNTILQSRTWRYTLQLRKVVDILKRLVRLQ